MAALQIPGPAHVLPNSTLVAGNLKPAMALLLLLMLLLIMMLLLLLLRLLLSLFFFLLLLRIPKQSLCLTVNDDCTSF